MNIALQITANLTIAFEPFLPQKSREIAHFLNIGNLDWTLAGSDSMLAAGHKLNQPEFSLKK
jgi:methionyl-tRNA synthetase